MSTNTNDNDLMTLSDFQSQIEKISRWARHGCSNHGCMIDPPKGMGTNSTCQCTPRAFSESLLWMACELDKHGKYGRWNKSK